ncbi:hypothetical protein [Polyangium aurulentum]|uniref:hypothetical protein n=1 Tax=Polyangium aurulentum TaxID=2567896 RepID=UPI0010AE43B4|nr:hypothetical protein [Polyangium aurulentum]UQA57535.1 hypothetical protein E8A73_040680 [Polyangium aurulentum]
MRLDRVDRLFHSIIVLGAAIGNGCSGNVEIPGNAGGAGGESASASGTGGGSSSSSSASSSSGGADGGVVDDPFDCAHSTQFFCQDVLGQTVCNCDPTAPAGIDGCDKTQDLHCQQYMPVVTGCKCVAGSPATQADCGDPDQFYFTCAIDEPPIGCHCITIIK